MPIQIKTITTQPNKTIKFDFDDNIQDFVVGISYWSFTFGDNDHHIKTLSCDLTTNQPTSKELTVQVSGQLDDDSGNVINNSKSSVQVTAIAVVGSPDSNYSLTTIKNIASGSQSSGIPLPSSSLSIGSTFLAGWKCSFGSKDHHVKQLQTASGFIQSGTTGYITSQAKMIDDSGNDATCSTSGGLVAASQTASGLLAQVVANEQTSSAVSVEFGTSIKQAAALLQSLVVTFGSDDHHVKTVGGGTSGVKVAGTKATLDNAMAFMKDDSGHSQKNSESHVTMIVFGVPE